MAPTYPNVGSENGIKALAAYVHSLGLKFGIYETAGISSQAVAENTPILGTSYTADDIATTTSQNNYNCGGMMAINYNAKGAQAYTDSVVNELASWGVDYIKLDGITDQNGPDIEAWQAAIQQLRPPDGARHDRGQLHHEARPDVGEVLQPVGVRARHRDQRTRRRLPANCNIAPYTDCTSVFPLTGYSSWDDRFDGVAQWQPYGGPGNFNDYDSIEVGDGSADSGHVARGFRVPAQPLVAGFGPAHPGQRPDQLGHQRLRQQLRARPHRPAAC